MGDFLINIYNAKDYYYILLHRIGSFVFNESSPFVSTTEDSDIADIFTGKWSYKNPGRAIKMVIISRPSNSFRQVLTRYKLPYATNFIYPDQKEFSFKGAITPNRILGYIKLETDEFVVNPFLLTSNQTEIDILRNGIDIDQSDFLEILDQTNYRRWAMTNERDYYEDFNRD